MNDNHPTVQFLSFRADLIEEMENEYGMTVILEEDNDFGQYSSTMNVQLADGRELFSACTESPTPDKPFFWDVMDEGSFAIGQFSLGDELNPKQIAWLTFNMFDNN